MSKIVQKTKSKFEDNLKYRNSLLEEARTLIEERANLEEKLRRGRHKCDTLKVLLECNTEKDVRSIAEEYFQEKKDADVSEEERERLSKCITFYKSHCIQKLLGVSVRRTKEQNVLIEIIPPLTYSPSQIALLKFNKLGIGYKLDSFILPRGIPIEELNRKFLDEKEEYNIAALIHAVSNCVWCFWMRDVDAQSVKKRRLLEDSLVYFNSGRTVISFTLSFMDKYNVEMKLTYDASSRFPDSVVWTEMDKKSLPKGLEDSLTELRSSMETFSLCEVFKANFESESTVSESDGEGSESSTVVFQLF